MASFGGLLKFRLPDGRNLTVRGSVSHMPTRMSFEKINNMDGSNDRSAKLEGYEFGLSLSNRTVDGQEVDWSALMDLEYPTFTVMGDTERMDRTFTRCLLFGRPSVDDLTGEVTGIQGVAEGYQAVAR